MSFVKRLGWLLPIVVVSCLYFPINRLMTGGYDLKTPLDEFIPTVPIFAPAYLLFLPYWVISFLFAAWKMKDSLFRAFIVGSFTVILAATMIYVAFPTYIDRPVLTGSGWGSWLLQRIYSHDDVYNAFPSGHVLFTTLIALFGSRWFPSLRGVFIGSVVLVIMATLFTGQHHLLDPIGGLGLGYAGYQIGLGVENGL